MAPLSREAKKKEALLFGAIVVTLSALAIIILAIFMFAGNGEESKKMRTVSRLVMRGLDSTTVSDWESAELTSSIEEANEPTEPLPEPVGQKVTEFTIRSQESLASEDAHSSQEPEDPKCNARPLSTPASQPGAQTKEAQKPIRISLMDDELAMKLAERRKKSESVSENSDSTSTKKDASNSQRTIEDGNMVPPNENASIPLPPPLPQPAVQTKKQVPTIDFADQLSQQRANLKKVEKEVMEKQKPKAPKIFDQMLDNVNKKNQMNMEVPKEPTEDDLSEEHSDVGNDPDSDGWGVEVLNKNIMVNSGSNEILKEKRVIEEDKETPKNCTPEDLEKLKVQREESSKVLLNALGKLRKDLESSEEESESWSS